MNKRTIRISVLLAIWSSGYSFAEAKHDDHGATAEAHHDEHVDEVKLTPDMIQRYGITIESVSAREIKPTVTAPARVSFNSDAMAHVGSVVKGRAIDIKVRVGDSVKKGDDLLIVESPDLGEAQSDFLQKRTAVSVAESAIEPAKSAAERAKTLYDQNNGISLGELQKRVAEQKAAEGALKTAQAALTAAENKLHLMGMDHQTVEKLEKTSEIDPRFTIRAPLAGEVVEREITLGELVAPEKDALLVLANMKTLWVIADVPEAQLRNVSIGAKARVSVPAVSDESLDGKVSLILPMLDANTRTAQVRIEVSNGHGLRPGMFATAEIAASSPITKPGAKILSIPEEALQTVEGGPAVFVAVENEPNTFAKRPVSVTKAVGGFVPVLSGLKEAERIVVRGSFLLKAELGKGEAAHEH